MSWTILLIIVGIFAVVVGIVMAVHKYEQARSEKLRTIAEEMGLDFYPKGDPSLEQLLSLFRLFQQGHGRKVKNLISGQSDDIDLAIFGYRYNTGGGQHQQTHQQTVISFQSPNLTLPEFELRPEHLFHKIGQAFGSQDIDFDTHPEFSQSYLLRGPDEDAIRELFVPDKLEFFEAREGAFLEANNDRLIYYLAGKRVKPEEIRKFMEEGFEIYGLFKTTPDKNSGDEV
ncbi:MAG: hypothetical protein ACR2NP_18295 [Pirellulaceae bacterium]